MSKLARLASIDMLRGLVIVLMALDHVRDFFGPATWGPEQLDHTTPAWFFTRWITHLCAPTFVLLAGSSAFLRGTGRGIPALSRYLATRGALLLLLEATWITFSWQFAYNMIIFQVLWALGMGMMFLSLLVWLPRAVVALIAVLLIVPHNLLDALQSNHPLWQAWHFMAKTGLTLVSKNWAGSSAGASRKRVRSVMRRFPSGRSRRCR